jgi:hypothetical protein
MAEDRAAYWRETNNEPRCDECGAGMEEVEWCGECGNCAEHCAGFQGCPDREEETK